MSYGINTNYVNNYELNKKYNFATPSGNQIQDPILQGSVTTVNTDTYNGKSGCTDGTDDGSIGFFSAVGNILKGGVKFFTGMFTDENGDFSLKQTLKSVGMVALIGLATAIPVVGPLVLPALCTYGMLHGAKTVITGVSNAMGAETDAEAKQAWQKVGSGATEGTLSYIGYKATGGLKGGWDKAKTEFNTLTSGNKPSVAPEAKPVETAEVKQLEAPKTTTNKTTLEKAKNVEPQGPKHNELAEGIRRDIVNERAAKVDAGEPINPSNAEIAAQGENLNIQHLKSNDARLVEKAYQDVPTAKQQASYDRQIAYQEPTAPQRQALNDLAQKNAVEYSEAHKVQNNAKGAEKLAEVKEQLTVAETTLKTVANGEYFLDGNRYIVENGKIVEMQLKGQQVPQTKELNIAKHNAKSNVLERIANGEASSKLVAKPQVAETVSSTVETVAPKVVEPAPTQTNAVARQFEGSQVSMHHDLNGQNISIRRSMESIKKGEMDKLRVDLEDIHKIDSEFAKLPELEAECTVYRGRTEHPVCKSFNGDFEVVKNAKVGDVIVPDEAYSYAGFDRSLAEVWANPAESSTGSIMYEIKLPKGAKVSRNLEHGGEAVFPRGAEYRVLSKTTNGNHTEIQLEYILPTKDNVAQIEALMSKYPEL